VIRWQTNGQSLRGLKVDAKSTDRRRLAVAQLTKLCGAFLIDSERKQTLVCRDGRRGLLHAVVDEVSRMGEKDVVRIVNTRLLLQHIEQLRGAYG
jgi:hypothetical protein